MKSKIFFMFLSVSIFSQVCFAKLCAVLKDVKCGEIHTLALDEDGNLFACGGDPDYYGGCYYELGLGELYNVSFLQQVRGPNGIGNLKHIIDFDAGWFHSLAVDSNGFCWSWGSYDEYYGLLGNGSEGNSSVPIRVHGLNNDSSGLRNIVKVSAGRSGTHSLAVDSNGYVYAWGNNDNGQCGDGSIYNIKEWPVLVVDSCDQTPNTYLGDEAFIVDVEAGLAHSLALVKFEDGGYVYEWGNGSNHRIPQKVKGEGGNGHLRNITDIATYTYSLAADSNGNVWEWTTGNNPVKVSGLAFIVKVAAGSTLRAGLDANGNVWKWTQGGTPVRVPCGQMYTRSGLLEDINAFDVGFSNQIVAVDKYGSGWAFCGLNASNDYGELGVGDFREHYKPVKMLDALVSEPNVWNINRNEHFTSIQSAINAPNTVNDDTLVVYPGLYRENVVFGSKRINLRSLEPNNPFMVTHTIISGDRLHNAVTVANNSTIKGFTIACGDKGIYCSNTNQIRHNIIMDSSRDGIDCYGGSAVISNNIIKNNGYNGISLSGVQSVTISNNTIIGNSYGICQGYDDYTNINSNIIWYNEFGSFCSGEGYFTNVNFNCIKDSGDVSGGIGNKINIDPCFVSYEYNNYHLRNNSPCIDNGDPNFVAEANETDIDGEDRINNSRIDIGADEFYPCTGKDVFPVSQPDSIVNFLDFIVIANTWLMEYPDTNFNEIVDFDNSGGIDIQDLKQLCDCWLWTTGQFELGSSSSSSPPAGTPVDANIIIRIVDINDNNEITIGVNESITLYLRLTTTEQGSMYILDVDVMISDTNLGSIDNREYDTEEPNDPNNGTARILAQPRDSSFDYVGPGYEQPEAIGLAAAELEADFNDGDLASFVFTCTGEGDVMLSLKNYLMGIIYPKLEGIVIHQVDPNSQQMMSSGGMFLMESSQALDAVDVDELLDWLDDLWETDESIRESMDPNSWLEFIESVKESQ